MELLLAEARRQYRHAPALTANAMMGSDSSRAHDISLRERLVTAILKNTVHKKRKLGFNVGQEDPMSVTMYL
ncbi:MAG: hypothetical protein U5L98_03870 [Halomonas sp.]|uniref:hypothetical protein n=1 Tax=Halomonas sp. TaxID=1486246 RepID=UPI002ACDCF3B|nr:hypothetical protein [Halomonas sp.]MDZ7851798.1 hypothetical protein [Halomonas sp.]